MKSAGGNHRWISTWTSLFSTKQVPNWKANWVVAELCWPKIHVWLVISLVLYYSKVNINSLESFMKSLMGIRNAFLLHPFHFLPSKSPFSRKASLFVVFLTQNTYVYVCRQVWYNYTVTISSYASFMNPWMAITDNFLLQPHYFVRSKSKFCMKTL